MKEWWENQKKKLFGWLLAGVFGSLTTIMAGLIVIKIERFDVVNWSVMREILRDRHQAAKLAIERSGGCDYVHMRATGQLLIINCDNTPPEMRERALRVQQQIEQILKEKDTAEAKLKGLPALEKEVQQLRSRASEGQVYELNLRRDIAKLSEDLSTRSTQLSDARQALGRLNGEVDDLKRRGEDATAKIKELDALAKQIPGLEAIIAVTKGDLEKARQVQQATAAQLEEAHKRLAEKSAEAAAAAMVLEEQRREAVAKRAEHEAKMAEKVAEAATALELQRKEAVAKQEELEKRLLDQATEAGRVAGVQEQRLNMASAKQRALEGQIAVLNRKLSEAMGSQQAVPVAPTQPQGRRGGRTSSPPASGRSVLGTEGVQSLHPLLNLPLGVGMTELTTCYGKYGYVCSFPNPNKYFCGPEGSSGEIEKDARWRSAVADCHQR